MEVIKFEAGSHNSREHGMCVMEAVAFLAGEEHTDRPQCADEIITQLAIVINDSTDDKTRNELFQDMPWRIIGTYTTDRELLDLRVSVYNQGLKQLALMYCCTPFNGTSSISIAPAYDKYLELGGRVWSSPLGKSWSAKDTFYFSSNKDMHQFIVGLKGVLDKLIEVTEIKEVVPKGNEYNGHERHKKSSKASYCHS